MGLIGLIRSISPILRVIVGLGMMFILPWIWMLVLGLALYGSMTPSMYSSPDSAMGFVAVLYLLVYGGAGVIFIIGIVMTISGIMDWWKAKQDN
jgi:hypothetical protein